MNSPRILALDPGTTKYQRYHARNKVRRNQESRRYQKTHLVERAEYMRAFRKANPLLFTAIEKRRVRPTDQRLRFNEYHRKWKRANPDKRLAYYHKRRAKCSVPISASDIAATRRAQLGLCYYCETLLDNNGRGHMEHMTPLARGGAHVIGNICFACSRCNLKKGTKTSEEFLNRD